MRTKGTHTHVYKVVHERRSIKHLHCIGRILLGLVKVSILIMEALFRWTWTGTGASSPLKQLKISFIYSFIHSFNIHFLLKIRRRREDIIIKTLHKTKPFSLRAHNRFFDAVGKHILLLFFFLFFLLLLPIASGHSISYSILLYKSRPSI